MNPAVSPAVQAQRSWTWSPFGLQAGTGTAIGSPARLRTVQVSQ